jgi:predicted SAM-dependent methyltransferase
MSDIVSETDTCRAELSRWCRGVGIDVGFGGSAITPTALTFDMPNPYTRVGGDRQILRGYADDLSMFCDGALDFIFSSHLLEDYYYAELAHLIIPEWRRVLRVGGYLITNCPDQQRFLAHCAATGQGTNEAHRESTFSLENFREKVMAVTGPWEEVFCKPEHGPYSFLTVHKKVEA